MKPSERANNKFLEEVSSTPRTVYDVAERLNWPQRNASAVARRLFKAQRVTRTGEGIIGNPFYYSAASSPEGVEQ